MNHRKHDLDVWAGAFVTLLWLGLWLSIPAAMNAIAA
jgi:hypothetical protein